MQFAVVGVVFDLNTNNGRKKVSIFREVSLQNPHSLKQVQKKLPYKKTLKTFVFLKNTYNFASYFTYI